MVDRKVEAFVKLSKSMLIVMILVSFCSVGAPAFAAPAPPQLMVNHESKQCAEYWAGDECTSCSAPAGWEVLGESPDAQCPDGYTQVEIELTCTHHKAEFCCTEGHSGAAGDCEDVVISRALGQCAFVEDIADCPALPSGWQRWGADCPYYEWADDLDCLKREVGGGVGDGEHVDYAWVPVVVALCMLVCPLSLVALLVVLAVWLWRRSSGPSAETKSP